MKTILIRIALIFLCAMSVLLVFSNGYMLFITIKLSQAKGFDVITVVSDYKLLQNIWVSVYSCSLTIIIIIVLMYFLIKEFIVKKSTRGGIY